MSLSFRVASLITHGLRNLGWLINIDVKCLHDKATNLDNLEALI